MSCTDEQNEFFRDREHEPIGFKFKLIHEGFVAMFNRELKEDDITFSQVMVISYLDEHKDKKVTQKDISEALHIKHPTTIGLLKRLEEKGMITNVTDPDNRRCRNVTLSEKGLEFVDKRRERRKNTDYYLVNGMTEDEIAALRKLLDKVIDNMGSINTR
ncbi:DNA-binding transcriptional regulator, MarR family [Butyrivibrio sp. Su6]|uniref:MarR family winged helix-turn-helix transcriptional regulator n=1 Tax=Butyrivibrio sp. Su6 TaxID=1520810 RepID=UPI00089F3E7C|nr:MarR family transcriptional regulator [Butyrivibrio sp. Su6]SEG03025.1 DNA-binding transcriptional regulator, MarR family [Butyrivibrio sp. Su6]